MADEVMEQTAELRAWKIATARGSAPDTAAALLAEMRARGVEALVVDSRMVFGTDHIRSALYHAKKALQEGRNVSDSLSMETLLYLSGERQLNAAITKMSPRQGSTGLVIARLAGSDLKPPPEWAELPSVVDDLSPARLAEFGISESELRTCLPGRVVELVLEKVAAVDVMKK